MVTTLFQHCKAVMLYKSSLRIVPCNITFRNENWGNWTELTIAKTSGIVTRDWGKKGRILSHRPKPLGHFMKFIKRSILYCFYTTLRWNFSVSWHFCSGNVHESVCLVNFLAKKIQKSESKNRTPSVVSAVHHLHHYVTEDLLARIGLIWSYIATTLTLNRS